MLHVVYTAKSAWFKIANLLFSLLSDTLYKLKIA